MVLDDIDAMGPISISQVETAQKEIICLRWRLKTA